MASTPKSIKNDPDSCHVLFDRGRRGPAMKDFDICGDRDRFDVFRVTDTRSAPPSRQKLLVCPVVGGRELAVADRDRRRDRLK